MSNCLSLRLGFICLNNTLLVAVANVVAVAVYVLVALVLVVVVVEVEDDGVDLVGLLAFVFHPFG